MMDWSSPPTKPMTRDQENAIADGLASLMESVSLFENEQHVIADALVMALAGIENTPRTLEEHAMTLGISRPTALSHLRMLKAGGCVAKSDLGWIGLPSLIGRVERSVRTMQTVLEQQSSELLVSAEDQRPRQLAWALLRAAQWAQRGFSPLTDLSAIRLIHFARALRQTSQGPIEASTMEVKYWKAWQWVSETSLGRTTLTPLGQQLMTQYIEQIFLNLRMVEREMNRSNIDSDASNRNKNGQRAIS